MLFAYANAICDELTVGVRSNRLCPFATEAAAQDSRQMSDRITDRRQGSAANMNLRRIELSSRKMAEMRGSFSIRSRTWAIGLLAGDGVQSVRLPFVDARVAPAIQAAAKQKLISPLIVIAANTQRSSFGKKTIPASDFNSDPPLEVLCKHSGNCFSQSNRVPPARLQSPAVLRYCLQTD